MQRIGELILKYQATILAIISIITIFFLYQLPKLRLEDELEMWFSEDDPILRTYRNFRDIFPSDEVNILAYQTETPFSKSELEYLSYLTHQLEQLPHVREVISLTNIEDVVGLEDSLEVGPFISFLPHNLEGEEWLPKRIPNHPFIPGTLISLDQKVLGIIITIQRTKEEANAKTSREFAEACQQMIAHEKALTGREFFLAGPTIFDAEVARMIEADMRRFLPLSLIITALILFLAFRSVTAVLFPVVSVSLAGIWTLGLKGFLGVPLTPVSPTLFALISVIGLANSVHLIHHYRLELSRGALKNQALSSMFKKAARPCFLCSFTTAIGFGSLAVSHLPIIKNLGIFAGFGVFTAFLLALTVVPISLSWTRKPFSEQKDIFNRSLAFLLRQIIFLTQSYPKTIVSIGLISIFVMSLGIPKIDVRGDMLQYLRKGTWFRNSAHLIDDQLGGISNLEIILKGKPGDFKNPVILRKVENLEGFIRQNPGVSNAYSIVSYLKLINRALNNDEPSQFRIPESQEAVAQSLLLYELSGGEKIREYLTPNYDQLRISLRTRDMKNQERHELLASVRSFLEMSFSEFQFDLTGITQLFERVNHQIVRTQIQSLVIAFLVILVLMLLNFGLKGGVISIIPNIFPIVFIFGLMGYAGFTLNVGTAIIAAIAIGLVVDDTIHYFSHFRYEYQLHGDRQKSAAYAISGVGSALCFSSLALVLGFGIFLLSESAVLVEFGFLSGIGILTALLGDLFLSPILLVKFSVFEQNRKK